MKEILGIVVLVCLIAAYLIVGYPTKEERKQQANEEPTAADVEDTEGRHVLGGLLLMGGLIGGLLYIYL